VADFGLAGVEAAAPSEILLESGKVTRTGALVGTPAYMAPEQWRASWESCSSAGRTVDAHARTEDGSGALAQDRGPARLDARADQFSFCVALFEALYGRRPFAGQTLFALQNAVLHDTPRVPAQPQVPARVKRALLRGLSKDPAARFASMTQLLAALALKQRSRALPWTLASLIITLTVAALAVLQARRDPCADAAASFAAVWNDRARTELRAHVLATGGSHAGEVAARTLDALSRYADAWKNARTATCRATHDQHVQSEPLLDVRMACLDDRARDFAALLAATGAQPSTLDAAVAVARLAPPQPCQTVRFDGDLDALPAAQQKHVQSVRATISQARAQLALAQYPRTVELTTRARAEAEAHGLTVLRVDAALEEAAALRKLAQHDKLEALLKESRILAARLGDPVRIGQLIDRLVDLHLQRGAVDTAQLLLEEYRLQNTVAGEPPHLVYGYQYMAGRVYQQRGDYQKSYAAYQEALELGRARFSHDVGRLAITMEGCGIAAQYLGRLDESRKLLEEAVARGMEAYGEHHPIPSLTRLNLGIVYKQQGQYDLAEKTYLAALRVFEVAHPGAHPDTAALLNNLCSLALERGQLDRAMPYCERAAAMRSELFGADSPTLVYTYVNMGLIRLGQRRPEEAQAFLQRSIDVTRSKLGEDHPKRALAEIGLGELAILRGQFEDALAHFEQAARVTLAASGAEHPVMAQAHAGAAYALASLGRCTVAIPRAQRALELVQPSQDRELPARAHFSLALCLGQDRKVATAAGDALAQARKARQALAEADPGLVAKSPTAPQLKAQIERWLERHGG
jgi:tetratricopeptide (TPR) repeat protein